MEENDALLKNDDKKEEDGVVEYRETRRSCCGNCTMKCMVISFSILLIIDFCQDILLVVKVYLNIYFDDYFQTGILVLVCLVFVSVILVFIHLVYPDSRYTRALVPWAFLIASIASFLIALWIIVYIFGYYDKSDQENTVLVSRLDEDNMGKRERRKRTKDENPRGDDIDDRYSHRNKEAYVCRNALSPIVFGIIYLVIFF